MKYNLITFTLIGLLYYSVYVQATKIDRLAGEIEELKKELEKGDST